MSPIAINIARFSKTKYELNGPVLSFSQQPVSSASTSGGSVTLSGIATATFPTQLPPNEVDNSGTISYQWYEVGIGSVFGETSESLNLSDLTSPTDSGRQFYLESSYNPVSKTGVAINSPIQSNTVEVTVYPTISITTQPQDTSVAQDNFTSISVVASLSDTTQGSLSYQWQLDGSNLSDGATVSGANTPNLNIAVDTIGTYTVRCVITHPVSGSSPLTSDEVTLTVVEPRPIIKIEAYKSNSSTAILSEINLEDQELSLNASSYDADYVCLYASEKDIDVQMDMYGAKGSDVGSFTGGEGGYSRVSLTMQRGDEYIISGLLQNSAIFLYRKSSLVAVVGKGGDAGTAGNGGAGSGVNLPGNSAPNGGSGGELLTIDDISLTGVFGSIISSQILYPGDSIATVPSGGKTITCTKGVYWREQGYSPCDDIGSIKFRLSDGTEVSNSAVLSRGFKDGYIVNQTGGLKSVVGGGNGGAGGIGGDGSTNNFGGGGGSGFTDGTITTIQSTIGGNSSSSRIGLRLQGGDFYVDSEGRILILSCTDIRDPNTLTLTTGEVLPNTNTCIDDARWQNFLSLAQDGTQDYRLTATLNNSTALLTNATSKNIYRMLNANQLTLRSSLNGWVDMTYVSGYSGRKGLAWDESSGASITGIDYSLLWWASGSGWGYYGHSGNPFFTKTVYGQKSANWWILPPGVPDFS